MATTPTVQTVLTASTAQTQTAPTARSRGGASDVVARDESPTVLTARVRNAAERARFRLAAAETDLRYRSILESAGAVVWVLDADGDIEYATPAVESRMGYTPTDLERTAIDRLVHPDDRAAVRETLAFVTDAPVGTTDRVTPRLGHADGTWQVSELTLTNRLADPTVEGSSSPEPVRARRPIRQSMTGFVRASTGSRTRFSPLARGTNSGMRTTPRCRCSSAPIPVSAGNWDRDEHCGALERPRRPDRNRRLGPPSGRARRGALRRRSRAGDDDGLR